MAAHDVDVRKVVVAGALVAGGVAAAVLAVAMLLRHWDVPLDVDPVRTPAAPREPAAAPALHSAPQFDLQRYRAEKERLLATTEWVAGEPGIVRIPIDTAMALLAGRAASAAQGRP
ncbi:MAG TPA: hypothetical protein VKI18_16610 [Albitalea sp.]|nr:hypothetical protein [Albitalea sp.]